jgi:hypothetical protein
MGGFRVLTDLTDLTDFGGWANIREFATAIKLASQM